MRDYMTRFFTIFCLGALLLWGATVINGDRTMLGRWDATGATGTLPFQVGTLASRPSTCTVGQVYFATDGVPDRKTTTCTATNNWTTMAYTQGTVSALPGSCTSGQIYFATDAAAGQNLYFCGAGGTYAHMAGSGGPLPVYLPGVSGNTTCGSNHYFGLSAGIDGTGESDAWKVAAPVAGNITTVIVDIYQTANISSFNADGIFDIIVGSTTGTTTHLSTTVAWPFNFGFLHQVYTTNSAGTALSLPVSLGTLIGGHVKVSTCTSGTPANYYRFTAMIQPN